MHLLHVDYDLRMTQKQNAEWVSTHFLTDYYQSNWIECASERVSEWLNERASVCVCFMFNCCIGECFVPLNIEFHYHVFAVCCDVHSVFTTLRVLCMLYAISDVWLEFECNRRKEPLALSDFAHASHHIAQNMCTLTLFGCTFSVKIS